MNQNQLQRDTKRTNLFGCVIGCIAGLFQAILFLCLLVQSHFILIGLNFFVLLIIAMALPQCLRILRSQGLALLPAEISMDIFSFLICIGYTFFVSNASSLTGAYSSMFSNILLEVCILHVVEGISIGVFAWNDRRRK